MKEIDFYDWKPIATISKLLKRIARYENLAFLTAAQYFPSDLNSKKGDNKEEPAYSKAIKQNSDIFLKTKQNTEQELIGECELQVLKVRRKYKIQPIILHPKPEFGIMDVNRDM